MQGRPWEGDGTRAMGGGGRHSDLPAAAAAQASPSGCAQIVWSFHCSFRSNSDRMAWLVEACQKHDASSECSIHPRTNIVILASFPWISEICRTCQPEEGRLTFGANQE